MFLKYFQKSSLYKHSLTQTLQIYEKYILPVNPQRVSLLELKKKEFIDRKKLLNPYQKELLLSQETNRTTQLETLAKVAKIDTMKSFDLTFNRHAGKYGYREKDFPKEYSIYSGPLDFVRDPDYSEKFKLQRLNLKAWALFFAAVYYFGSKRLQNVAEFDRLKRQEQRAMQNKELESFKDKSVKFCLFSQKKDNEFKQFTQQTVRDNNQYTILWYDSKMKNYIGLLEYLAKKKLVSARIKSYLIVDKLEQVQNVDQIRQGASDIKLKSQVQVLYKRELTDQESLVQSFSDSDSADAIDLDMKKNFFYVISPEGKIIDCAKIYSFLHEDNIYQRIIAKTLKNVDDRNSKSS